MSRARDLAEIPAWRRHRRGRDTCAARVCFGPGARLLTGLARADALVLGRRVFLAPRIRRLALAGAPAALALLEHELVHVEQYRRLGWRGFLIRYLGDYFAGRRRGLSHWRAYRSISLEEEARRLAAQRMTAAAQRIQSAGAAGSDEDRVHRNTRRRQDDSLLRSGGAAQAP